MLKVFGNDIALTRGDTARLALKVKNADGTIYELQEGDKVYFTIRSADGEEIVSREVTNGIVIYPADTAGLPYGTYDYDVEVVLANGDVNTIIVAKLDVRKEVRE